MRYRLCLLLAVVVAACASQPAPTDPWRDELRIASITPGTVIPGSVMVVSGTGFVYREYGKTWLHLAGDFAGRAIDVRVEATVVDGTRLEVPVDAALLERLGGQQGDFTGGARVEIARDLDESAYRSNGVSLSLAVRPSLQPHLAQVAHGVFQVNDAVEVAGSGFLLGGSEGETRARVWGCLTTASSSCVPVDPVEVVVHAETSRGRGVFALAPAIAGILSGEFRGTVELYNVHGAAAGAILAVSEPRGLGFALEPPGISAVAPEAASLGRYLELEGGGFLDGSDGVSLLKVEGSYAPDEGDPRTISVTLVPEFIDGRHARYVLDERDPFGLALALRRGAGRFQGTIQLLSHYQGDSAAALPLPVALRIEGLKQVILVSFQPSYSESLRHFGLRGVDERVRRRVIRVAEQAYQGVNVEFRTDPPRDFALYAQVDIDGPDPNGSGLLGYDNTPGKDVNNARLHDRIGGVNAQTQEDGSPGYGGIFVESLFAYSEHPEDHGDRTEFATGTFDDIFDPFRPDRGGRPVEPSDLAAGIPELEGGGACPAPSGSRSQQIACAVWVLGGLIGTTMAHEVGHSLGLANPLSGNEDYHNFGDQPDRIMDAGGARPFAERAQLFGEGPGVFCDEDFTYLAKLMPSDEPPPDLSRPPCD